MKASFRIQLLVLHAATISCNGKLKILPKFTNDDEIRQKSMDNKSDFVPRSTKATQGENHEAFVLEHQSFISKRLQGSYQKTKAIYLMQESFFGQHFNVRTPRHLWEGFLFGLENISDGCWKGMTGILEHGYQGWKHAGFAGVLTGSVIGTMHGALLAIGGVLAGVYQMGAGIGNTPQALTASKEGKMWDDENKVWRVYKLDEEHQEVERQMALTGSSDKRSRQVRQRSKRKVQDMTFYNLLKVTTDASPSEIKRAYYREALQTHPDKSTNSESSERFQELSSAYQILTNEETRDAYDKQGMCFVKNKDNPLPKVDAYTFFAVMFGSYLVEPYVGELRIASMVDNFLKLTEVDTKRLSEQTEDSLKQQRRVLDIALHLRDRIGDFVHGEQSEAVFRASIQLEASAIAKGEFGDSFLKAIGRTLMLGSKKFLADQKSLLGLTSVVASLETSRRHLVDGYMTTVGTAGLIWDNLDALTNAVKNERMTKTTTKLSKDMCSDSLNVRPETLDLMQKLERSLPKALRLVEQMNNSDIHQTVKDAVEKVLHDQATDETRRLRAKALGILGSEFHQLGMEATKKDRWADVQALKQGAERALFAAATMDDAFGEQQ